MKGIENHVKNSVPKMKLDEKNAVVKHHTEVRFHLLGQV